MKKGFTLVELLGVIVIIGILVLVAIPVVQVNLKASKQKAYDTQITNIKIAMQNWKVENKSYLPKPGETIYLTIGFLKSQHYLENSMINVKTEKEFPNDMLLTITNQDGYQYDVLANTGTEFNETYPSDIPVFIMDRGPRTEVNIGDTYVGPTFNLKLNSDITTPSLVTTTEIDGKTLDTSKAGIYHFIYKVTFDKYNYALGETVVVK